MMKFLQKFLAIAFLAVSIFILGLRVDFASAQNTAVGPAASRPPVDPILSPYVKFGRINTEDGLSNDRTWQLAQERRGFMWFGTGDGLSRYDGTGRPVCPGASESLFC